jgi:cbb3-type cytochrome oxidase maturation protein
MTVLYVLVPMALLLAAAAVTAFLWAARDGQLDDLDSPPLRVLHDDEPGKR